VLCACGLTCVRILATRTRDDGIITRRRECVDGHRWTSYELHESVARGIGLARLAQHAGRLHRGTQGRQQAQALREVVAHRPDMTASALAVLIGRTEARVRQIRAALAAPEASAP
jgi:transcriptional regulator NrdR family protein